MQSLIGVFWGAFDPLTKAHLEIISESLKNLPLERLIIVVNNHSYKNYTYPLNERIEKIHSALDLKNRDKIEILFQDDEHPVNYLTLETKAKKPLCAIAGSDAYLSWIEHSSKEERLLYAKIAVVPRGDAPFNLLDPNAVLLPIDKDCRYISSTKNKKITN